MGLWAWLTERDTTALSNAQNRMYAIRERENAFVAAAVGFDLSRDRSVLPKYQPWQEELWGFFEELPEFNTGVMWLANRVSRLRLRAARLDAAVDEPVIVDDGSASKLVEELAENPAAQAEMLATLSVHLSVPGESWLLGETDKNTGENKWKVKSGDELESRSDGYTYVLDDDASLGGKIQWRKLTGEFLITRIWQPHKRKRIECTSSAKSARGIMRELELVNRTINSGYLSRLATAGLLLLPEEVTFPVREEFEDEDDPFTAEFIAVASQAIRTPGTAAAVVPIPMRMAAEYIDKVKHLELAPANDEKLVDKRNDAIRRLANKLDLPTEALLGMGDTNHWSAWQIDEDSFKTHIAPHAEVIVHGLTLGYLHPRLKALGEDPDKWVVWYDASELTVRPDRSKNAIEVFDRLALSEEALRREMGFDEADAPEDEMLGSLILKLMAKSMTVAMTPLALKELTGIDVTVPDTNPIPPEPEVPEEIPAPEDNPEGPPDTKDNPPPPPDSVDQAAQVHVLQFGLSDTELLHPPMCTPKLFSCPFTHALRRGLSAYPGTFGSYECTMSMAGDIQIGKIVYPKTGEFVGSGKSSHSGTFASSARGIKQ